MLPAVAEQFFAERIAASRRSAAQVQLSQAEMKPTGRRAAWLTTAAHCLRLSP